MSDYETTTGNKAQIASAYALKLLERKGYEIQCAGWFSIETGNAYIVAIDPDREELAFATSQMCDGPFGKERVNMAQFEADAFEYLNENPAVVNMSVRLDSIKVRLTENGRGLMRHCIDVTEG